MGSEQNRRAFLQTSVALLSASCTKLHAAPVEVPPVDQRMQTLEDNAPMAMQFRGSTPDEARAWQKAFKSKLDELLGPYQPPQKWTSILERRVERSNHVREERVLTAEGIAPVPFHLLLPREPTKQQAKLPAVVAVHGHGEFAHDTVAGIDDTPEHRAEIERFKYDYGLRLVERGYIVAAPCMTPFGRRLGRPRNTKRIDDCTLVNLQMQLLGKLLMAENLRDILWSAEFLAQHEAVDADRLACVGLSLGGRMTMLAAAVEPRFKAAVIGGALNGLQERAREKSASGCQVIPGILAYGDVPEISALIAPRPCVWEVGDKDQHCPPERTERLLARQRRVYAALGATDHLILDPFEGGHVLNGVRSFEVLDKTLRRKAIG